MNSDQAIKTSVALGEAHQLTLKLLDKIKDNALADGVTEKAFDERVAEWFGLRMVTDLSSYRSTE